MPKDDTGPKALLVDIGGVILNFDRMETCRRLSQYSPYKPEQIHDLIFRTPLEHNFDCGKITPQQFYDKTMEVIKGHCTYPAFVDAWNSLLKEDIRSTGSILRRLHGKYRLILVSNTNVLHTIFLAERPFMRLFPESARIFSYLCKAIKPEAAFFQKAKDTAGCDEGVWFVDDIKEYVDKAQEFGMAGLVYKNTNNDARDGKRFEAQLRKAGFQF